MVARAVDRESSELTDRRPVPDRSVLTITDVDGGIEHGSVITFVQVDGRVRFEVNVAVAEKSGLRLSSRLLTVATGIKQGRPCSITSRLRSAAS